MYRVCEKNTINFVRRDLSKMLAKNRQIWYSVSCNRLLLIITQVTLGLLTSRRCAAVTTDKPKKALSVFVGILRMGKNGGFCDVLVS